MRRAFPSSAARLPMASLNDIRSTFLDFFARDGHEVVHSAPLVPQNDKNTTSIFQYWQIITVKQFEITMF